MAFLAGTINCLTSSNPLVRRSDRLEAMCVVLVAFIAIAAVPVVAHVGGDVHDARAHEIVAHNATLRTVEAQAVNDSAAPIGDALVAPQPAVLAQWNDGDQLRSETIDVHNFVRSGDRLTVWLDADGRPTSPPESPTIAVGEATLAAVALYLAVVGFAAFVFLLAARALHYFRLSAWDRQIRLLVDDDGDWVDKRG